MTNSIVTPLTHRLQKSPRTDLALAESDSSHSLHAYRYRENEMDIFKKKRPYACPTLVQKGRLEKIIAVSGAPEFR